MTKHFDNISPYKFQSDKNRKKRERRRRTLPGYPLDWPLETREEVNQYFATDRIVCLRCGKEYHQLEPHLRVHSVTVEEYQRFYGLPLTVGLVGRLRRETLAQRAIELVQKGVLRDCIPDEYLGKATYTYRPYYRLNEAAAVLRNSKVVRGEESASASLTEEQVRAIKADTTHTQRELAEQHGVCPGTINAIFRGKSWAHVDVPTCRPKYVKAGG